MKLFIHVHTRDLSYKPILLRARDAYDPSEARDPGGKWTSGGGANKKVPAAPGEAPIPQGMVRRFHYTSQNNIESIKQNGLTTSHSTGTKVGDPVAIWSNPDFPGWEKPVVEFWDDPKNYEANPIARAGNVPPNQIVAIHEPWHQEYREVKAGLEKGTTSLKNLRRPFLVNQPINTETGGMTYGQLADLIESEQNKKSHDAWEESKHPRGHPGNPGQFVSKGQGGSTTKAAPPPPRYETQAEVQPARPPTKPVKLPKGLKIDDSEESRWYFDGVDQRLDAILHDITSPKRATLVLSKETPDWQLSLSSGDVNGKGQKQLEDALREHGFIEGQLNRQKQKNTAPYPEAGGLVAPDDWKQSDKQEDSVSYTAPSGYILKLTQYGDFRLYMEDGRRLLAVGDTQGELTKAIEEFAPQKHEKTEPTHGQKPFANVDLAPPAHFELQYDGKLGKRYKDPSTNYVIRIASNGEWDLYNDKAQTVSVGSTQASMDEAVDKYSPSKTKRLTKQNKPFANVDLTPPDSFKLSDDNPHSKRYKNAAGNILEIREEGNWSLYPDFDHVAWGHGTTQAELDKVLSEHTGANASKTTTASATIWGPKKYEWGGVNTEVSPKVGRVFRDQIKEVFERLPSKQRESIKEAGIKTCVGETVIEVLPQLHNVRPRGWSVGGVWDQAEGLCSPTKKQIVVSQYRVDSNGNKVETPRGRGAIRHEAGHAFDDALGGYSKGSSFRNAYEEDKKTIDPNIKPLLAYYLQEGDAGPSECFAEVCGDLTGGGADPNTFVSPHFPKVAALIKGLLG